MNLYCIKNQKSKLKSKVFSTRSAGLGMRIISGIYHNLILPSINEKIHLHHEGLAITLFAYIILAYLMTYFYSLSDNNSIISTINLGIVVGIIWVFPHGLAMAAVHKTSI